MLFLRLQVSFFLAQVGLSLVLPTDGTLGQAVIQSSVDRQKLGGYVRKALVKAGVIPDGRSRLPLFYALWNLLSGFHSVVPEMHALRIPLMPNVSIGKRMGENKLSTDCQQTVLDDFNPAVALSISYVSKDKDVHLGNKIKPKAVQDRPKFSLETIPTRTMSSDATYVLALTDPDATSRSEPVKAQMCHWLVANITTQTYESSSRDSFGSENSEIMSYYPPAPPPKTGYHRYVFVLLATTKDIGSVKKPKDRPHWGYGKVGAGVREWAAENDMEILGANFFYAQNKVQ